MFVHSHKGDASPSSSPSKKKAYSLDPAKKKLIATDEENKKIWDEILTELCDFPVSNYILLSYIVVAGIGNTSS